MTIEVEIEGVSDRAVSGAIRNRVRLLGRRANRSEEWRVSLVPSEANTAWDLGIRTASGWHVASFTAPVEMLPDIVEQRVRAQLVVPAADASATGVDVQNRIPDRTLRVGPD